MSELGIVTIAYNRPQSLIRLLNSLNNAYYGDSEKVSLIISIDWSPNIESVYNIAESFNWKHGSKQIIKHEKNLGLKKHVMFCGDLTEKYESLIVLEDDIFVSPGYYSYAISALEYYKDNNKIAGISLYTPEWNQTANSAFTIEPSIYDTFFMKYAQSWGQVWTKNWWLEFKKWLKAEQNMEYQLIPNNVRSWPDKSSWLKDHIKFCIATNKYFVYPRVSFSTNFSEIGEHNNISSSNFQVSIFNGSKINFNFQPTDNPLVIYDAFFERENLWEFLNYEENDLVIDLYGTKEKTSKRYIISTKTLDYKIIKTYGLKLRPHELNVIFNIEGEEIKFYDTTVVEKNLKLKDNQIISRTMYDVRATSRKNLLNLLLFYFKNALIAKNKK